METTMAAIELRYFDSCPNWKITDERIGKAMSEIGMAGPVTHTLVDTMERATELGFAGSPTVLIDGVDPFGGDADTEAGLACRIYQTEDGPQGSPSLTQIRAALAAAMSVE